MAQPPSFLLLLVVTVIVNSLSPATAAKCHPEDKKVLLAIKLFWNNPSRLDSWVPSTGCCGWYGVRCDAVTGRVTDLTITDDTSIIGTIPPAVGDLRCLTSLELSRLPRLTGPIPSAITKLQKLILLRLESNDLTGPVPAFLAQIPELWYLNLGFNRLTGSIPGAIGGLPALLHVELYNNQLTGSIPAELGKLKLYTTLLLSNNNLSGPLPQALGAADFSTIDLSGNRLSGDATFLFGPNKTLLGSIDLSRNMFEFDFGKVVLSKVTEGWLSTIKLNHNRIYGRIPKQIAEMADLDTLDLSYNRLCGEIPTGVNMNKFNAEVYAHNPCLCGKPLPPCK